GQADRERTGWSQRGSVRPGPGADARMSTVTGTPGYDQVQVGQELPELTVPLTRTLIVATAIASRDYQDVHHDPELARARGSEDIFMNILSTNGFVGRFITDWAGPDGVLRKVAIRLGAPTYPGHLIHVTGKAT